jgi:formylglycine-generating enzyme required for sulfatase activity/energy-coupling factor transporter ATP-binding protein EcfA2
MDRIFWNDRPILSVTQDRFDFSDYADALSNIVLRGDTPVTIGIFGPWGSGKTSLMRLTAGNLQDQRTRQHRHAHVVWFNAWQYDSDSGAIWRTLLLQVLEKLRTLDLKERDRRKIQDWEARLYADVQRTEQGALEVDWAKVGKGSLRLALSLMPTPAGISELLKTLEGDLSNIEEVVQAFQREKIEIYRRQLTLLEEFQAGFAHLVKEYMLRRNGLMVLCVDDLDRCLPDRALEVLETIKLFLDVPGCVFLLAVDHRRIESVIQERFAGEDEAIGENYLEKLVQLPFYMPPIDEDLVGRFLDETAPDLPDDVQDVFAAGLAPNPRMVKRTLNIYQLLQALATRRVERGALAPVDPVLLAKIVVIQARFRDLYQDLIEYPNLIQELELRVLNHGRAVPVIDALEKEPSPLLEKYADRRALMRMLSIGKSFTEISPNDIAAYIYLARPTGEDAVAESPRSRLWDDLQSNDITRIRAAVGRIRQRGYQQQYVDALTHLVVGEREATMGQRLSAAMALGYLGDPRELDAVVEIPGGEFLYGEEGAQRYLPGYRIGKYPVTNAQYAAFLKANPKVPVPFVDADWAQPYNWDPEQRTFPEGKANLPVVLVTHREARAYAAWVGGRLPTEEEWERAARGDNGRSFPWGETPTPSRANVRESGLGSPTPVGVYLDGRSSYGLLDAAGNVWEWTVSDFNGDTKSIRGGAWNFSLDSARTFVRECSHPDNRSHSIGFRVAFDLC